VSRRTSESRSASPARSDMPGSWAKTHTFKANRAIKERVRNQRSGSPLLVYNPSEPCRPSILAAANVKALRWGSACKDLIILVFWLGPTNMMSMDTPFFRRCSAALKACCRNHRSQGWPRRCGSAIQPWGEVCREGATQDYAQAAHWYLKAATNHSLAQFNLAIMYAVGQGVARDEAASRGGCKGGDRGDAGAQYQIGMKHHRDSLEGLPEAAPESRIQAYKWLQLSAAQGYRGSEAAWHLWRLA